MRINRSSSLFGLFLLIGVTTLEAQPKIGLVLGGGGARGAAHVGVLKVLERNRIPVHCIAGTSMGAIIGGFYASGLNAEEIETVLAHIDWEDSFIDHPPRPNLSMRRKEDDLNFLIDLSVGFNGQGVLLPRGLVQGQKQNRIFREIVQPVLHISDFDNLPTPFRAVATDIKEGESVVLRSGSLVAAMRASMSIPAIFAPVELDHYLLVDGGITNNLPVDVIKQMGADIIIAVDVSAGLLPEEELNTAINITDQVSNIVMQNSNDLHKQLLSARDVLIVPQLSEVGSADFLKVLRAVPKGETAAQAQLDKLKSLALSETEYAQYQRMRSQKRVHTPVEIDFIEINNDSKVSSRIIRAQLTTQPGDTLDLPTLEQDIANIYSMDLFENVDAHLFNSDGQRGLQIDAKRKAWGPNYFNFGLDFTDDFGGGSAYNFVTRYTRTEINARAAEWRNDLQVGEEPRLFSEFYQPFDVELRYFLAASIELQQTGVDLFEQGERYAELRVNTRNFELQVGRMFGNWGELRLGVLRGDGETRLRTGDPDDFSGVQEHFDSGRYTLRFRYDTLDNVRFPTSGARVEFDADYSRAHMGGDERPYDLYRVGWLKARTRGRHTFLTRIATGTLSKGAVNGFQNQFRLGGFLNLSGLNTGERVGAHFAIADIIFYRRFGSFEENLFDIPLYIGGSLELGNVWETRDDASIDNTLTAGSLFVGADTFLGPLYLAAGLTEGGHSGLYFFLGRSF